MQKAVFVIGNGFDINIGLKTGYRDYIESKCFRDFLELDKNKDKELFKYLDKINRESRWIDIELELEKYSETADSNYLTEYKELKQHLCEYIKSIEIKLNYDSAAFKLFKEHCEVDSIILSFNYTNTINTVLENIPELNGVDTINIHYVHGSAAENNIIFGVDDDAGIEGQHNFLYKTHSKNFNAHIYWKLHNAKNVFFFGHSLGKSDHMYFRDFFNKILEMDTGMKLYFYHYGDEGYSDLDRQLRTLVSGQVARMKSYAEFKSIDVAS